MREVLARVRSVLRRTAPQEGQSRAIAFEGLHMDLVRKICTVDGTPLALTKKEFEILALLLSNRGRIFSREEILHQVWSDEVIVLTAPSTSISRGCAAKSASTETTS